MGSRHSRQELEKHAVDSVTTAEIFDDPDLLMVIDSRAHSERPNQAIGGARGAILFVASTMRGNNICRIISVRKASRRDRAADALQAGARSQT